jgi:hypothetical protein
LGNTENGERQRSTRWQVAARLAKKNNSVESIPQNEETKTSYRLGKYKLIRPKQPQDRLKPISPTTTPVEKITIATIDVVTNARRMIKRPANPTSRTAIG